MTPCVYGNERRMKYLGGIDTLPASLSAPLTGPKPAQPRTAVCLCRSVLQVRSKPAVYVHRRYVLRPLPKGRLSWFTKQCSDAIIGMFQRNNYQFLKTVSPLHFKISTFTRRAYSSSASHQVFVYNTLSTSLWADVLVYCSLRMAYCSGRW